MIRPPPAAFVPAPVVHRSFDAGGTPGSLRTLVWGLAALVIASLHIGIFLVLTRLDAAEAPSSENSLAAVMVDLAPVPVPARQEVVSPPETPPETPAETPAETASDETPPPEVTAPPEIPMSPPPPPDVKSQAVLPAVPKPEPRKLQKKPQPLPKDKPPKPADPMRRPKRVVDLKTTTRSGGGSPPSAQASASTVDERVSAASRASWQSEVRSRIVHAKRFPPEAHGVTGVAVVSVTFTASGGASGVRLVTSSGSAALDAEAVAVMYRAAPYPPPPEGRAKTMTIPLNFRRQ